MTLDEARAYLSYITTQMEDGITSFVNIAELTQEAIYTLLQNELATFDIVDGRFVQNQPIARKISIIERRINEILAQRYNPSVANYLSVYDIVDTGVKYLHKEVNDITVTDNDIKNVRASVYNQAEVYLTKSVADAYVQPAKFLLMQTVTHGQTIKQAQSMLKNWNDGELGNGKLATGVRNPRLQAYAGQIARDSLFQYNGTIQDNIGQRYGLKNFIYVGGLVKESRPFCRHLVGLKRKISIDEVPRLVERYPEGLVPNTTRENFPTYRGGFNCLHNVMMVR